jgi:hypothetical protein
LEACGAGVLEEVDEYAHFELWNKLIYLFGRTLARKEYIGISITLGDGIRKLAIF